MFYRSRRSGFLYSRRRAGINYEKLPDAGLHEEIKSLKLLYNLKNLADDNQFTNILLEETEASGGFKISAQGNIAAAATRDDYFYALIGKRDKFKDRINERNKKMDIISTIFIPSEKNVKALKLIKFDWSKYQNNLYEFTKEVFNNSNGVLISSPNDFQEGLKLIRRMRTSV